MSNSRHLPLNIGHRGHANQTENTIASFHEACDMGAEMLELDVRISGDGVPLVFHDKTLRRMFGGKRGSVPDRSTKFLTSLTLGDGHRIPTLAETLEALLPRVPLNLELKFNGLNYRPLVEGVLRDVMASGQSERVLVSSFCHHALNILKRYQPEIATAPLFGHFTGPIHPHDFEALSATKPTKSVPFSRPAAVVYNKLIDEKLAKEFRDRKLALLTYTVDEEEEMRRLIGLGIDGIITNRPDRLDKVLKSV